MTGPAPTLGTLSVLFTDVVGSTARRARIGDEAADQLQQAHDDVVLAAVRDAGGTVVKHLGDGAMATFPAVADAIRAAVAIQQGLERHAREAGDHDPVALRVGISTGDVSIDGDDVFGTAVIEASRLCAVAAGGEILVPELARLLARGRGGFAFEPVGEVELKGLPEPVATCRVLWEPLVSPAEGATPPLPPPLAGPPPLGFVGRQDVLDALKGDLSAVRDGGHRTALLAGEPGIGKTRLATEFARAAHEAGATVLFGRCDEELGVPYQPFVEALEHHLEVTPEGLLDLGRLPGELVRLVPSLAQRPGVGAPVASDPKSEEFRLFEAVTSWLMSAAARAGLVLILDDLHWATKPTLQMLRHLLRHAPERQGPGLLTIITYRDTDVSRSHPLAAALADLRRLPGVTRHAIGGLTGDEVVQLAAGAAGHQLDEATASLAASVRDETEGNPFFVGEVLRHLIESGAVRRVEGRWQVDPGTAFDVPEGVRDVVGRRVDRLSEGANALLSVAAVVGRDVPLDVVAEVADLSEDAVLDALDDAVRARLLEEVGADRYRFSHALVRTTLYEELSATRARRLHRRVADALAKLHPDDVLGLANQLLAAGPENGDVGRACRAVLTAGRQALDRRSPADAEQWFRQALELLDDPPQDERLWVESMTGLGTAQRDQGSAAFRDTLLRASRRALELGEVDLLCGAVLANNRGFVSIVGQVDEERVALIEAALAALDGVDEPDRRVLARLTALLASELLFAGDATRQRALADQAVALARATEDLPTVAEVAVRSTLTIYDFDDPSVNLRQTEEAMALADELGDPSLRSIARFLASAYHLALGDFEQARATTEAARAVATDASPNARWAAEAHALKLVVGARPVAEAAAANDACLAMGEAGGEPDAANWWAAVACALTYLGTGGLGSLLDLITDFEAQYGAHTPTWRLVRAWALADAGQPEEASALLHDPSLDPRETVEDVFPYIAPHMSARIAWLLRDPELAAPVEALLRPHGSKWSCTMLMTFGPITHGLGLCAATRGDHGRGTELLREAVAQADRVGMPVLANAMRYDLGQVLLDWRGPDDPELAALVDAIIAASEAHGSHGLAERARALTRT